LSAQLLIVGASARAAAQSALRAGITPCCVDQFADLDLSLQAEVIRAAAYPRSLPQEARAFPKMPFMYTGALENHPRVVQALSNDRPLWGTSAAALRAVRDPWRVRQALCRRKLPCLEVWPRGRAAPPPDGGWLLKPRRGSGGRGISIWNESSRDSPTLHAPHYFQRRVLGFPASAVCVALPDRVHVAGLTRQLIGQRAQGAMPFQWCGNVAPLRVAAVTVEQIQQIAMSAAVQFGLRGLFGCDFIIDGDTAWLTELNPRYTGAVEVVEQAHSIALVGWHCRAFEPAAEWALGVGGLDTQPLGRWIVNDASAPPGPSWGKAVLYATFNAIVGNTRKLLDCSEGGLPLAADLPSPGARIGKGEPVCTLFASAPTEEACLRELAGRCAWFQSEYLNKAD
jgi:predicted ATP-grasp superfamily ATP-dependent carboligase